MNRKRKAFVLMCLAFAFAKVWGLIRYLKWRKRTVEALTMNGQLAATAVGLVEYAQEGQGPTILLCHGAPGGYDQGHLIKHLTRVGFSTLTPSRPGYLGTPLSTGKTIEEQADAMVALMDRLGIEKTAVIGASAGGPIALQLALRHPERVWGLVMEAGISQAYQPNDEVINTPLGRLTLAQSDIADIGLWLLNWFSKTFIASAIQMTISTESNLPPNLIEQKSDQIVSDPAQTNQFEMLTQNSMLISLRKDGINNDLLQLAHIPRLPLEEINTPTLAIHGRFDTRIPYQQAQFVADTVPNAELITLETSGHLIWLGDEWKEVEPRLVKFLNDNAPE